MRLEHAAKHGFQITAFLHMRHERMIATGTGHFQDLHGTAGEKCGATNHVDKLLFTDQSGAGAGQ